MDRIFRNPPSNNGARTAAPDPRAFMLDTPGQLLEQCCHGEVSGHLGSNASNAKKMRRPGPRVELTMHGLKLFPVLSGPQTLRRPKPAAQYRFQQLWKLDAELMSLLRLGYGITVERFEEHIRQLIFRGLSNDLHVKMQRRGSSVRCATVTVYKKGGQWVLVY